GVHHCVATARNRAVIAAAVGVAVVAIIALLPGFQRPIAAAFAPTVPTAAVAGGVVPVVALLPSVQVVVAADGFGRAHRATAVAVPRVAIIADFARVDATVSTQRFGAVVAATIRIVQVAVVTAFAEIEHAVTAHLEATTGAATVAADGVAVVARLAGVDHPVTAAFCLAVPRAIVGARKVVSVVAFFAGIERAVTTTRQLTIVATRIGIDGIAVIALLGAFFLAVAADGRLRAARAAAYATVALFAGVLDAVAAFLDG